MSKDKGIPQSFQPYETRDDAYDRGLRHGRIDGFMIGMLVGAGCILFYYGAWRVLRGVFWFIVGSAG